MIASANAARDAWHLDHGRAGIILAFAGYAAFALSDACVRLLGGAISPFQVTFTGAMIGLALLPLTLGRTTRPADLFAGPRAVWVARAVTAAIASAASVTAFSRLAMPEAFALMFVCPIFVTLLSMIFLGERIGAWRGAAVMTGFLGVLIVLRPGLRSIDLGHVAALVCAVASAVVILLLRVGGAEAARPASMLGAGLVGSAVLNGVLMLPTLRWPDGHAAGLLAGYGSLALVGQALLVRASRRIVSSRIAPVQYSQMIWAVLLSYLVFGQHVDRMSFVGIAVIMASSGITSVRERIRALSRLWMPGLRWR